VHRRAPGKSGFPPPGEGRNTTREAALVKAGRVAGKRSTAARGRADAAGGDFSRNVVGREAVAGGFDEAIIAPGTIAADTSDRCVGSTFDRASPVKYRKNTGSRWYGDGAHSPVERI